MQARPKARVYGKKCRQQDNLDVAFASLSLEKSSLKGNQIGRVRAMFDVLTIQLTMLDEFPVRAALRTISSNLSCPPGSDLRVVENLTGTSTRIKRQEAQTQPTSCSRKPRPDSRSEITKLTSLAHVKDEIHDFEQACHLWANNYAITKIAHGSYAAIFRLQLRSDKSKYIIAKLMPLKPKSGKGSRAADQTSIEDAANEVKALDTMSEVPGFVGFSEAWVLKGCLPTLFLQEYEIWAQTHPDDRFTDYSTEQLWCFIEMSDAGTDLERLLQKSDLLGKVCVELSGKKPLRTTHCWDIFWGIAEALGRGEEFSEFEHRDLHPGNVCIIKNEPTARGDSESPLRTKYTNLEVTLIDYTLSRATLSTGEVLANPMRDKSIFKQRIENPCTQQQLNDNRQYETYRKMRQTVIELSHTKDEGQAWQSFVPQTNMLWLHHILTVLICSTAMHRKACVDGEDPKVRIKKSSRKNEQPRQAQTAEDDGSVTEEAMIGLSLESLRDSLDPDRTGGCRWSSAKALLESDLYWTSDTCLDRSVPFNDDI